MKQIYKLLVLILILPLSLFAQEEGSKTEEKAVEKIQKPAFESALLIDNQTSHVLDKKNLQFTIQHRFGEINGGVNDVKGLWGPSNIRLGLEYGLTNRIAVGFGTTKDSRLQDFNLKVALLRQTVSNKMPVSITYYGNMVIDARTRNNFNYLQHRWSYFNEIMISRRINDVFSVQVAANISHFNFVEANMENDMIAIAFGGRAKVSPQASILFDYSQPLTQLAANQPKPGISLGVEFNTGAHSFQIFVSNNKAIVPQQNYYYNQNNFFNGDFLIGFAISRLWYF